MVIFFFFKKWINLFGREERKEIRLSEKKAETKGEGSSMMEEKDRRKERENGGEEGGVKGRKTEREFGWLPLSSDQ